MEIKQRKFRDGLERDGEKRVIITTDAGCCICEWWGRYVREC